MTMLTITLKLSDQSQALAIVQALQKLTSSPKDNDARETLMSNLDGVPIFRTVIHNGDGRKVR